MRIAKKMKDVIKKIATSCSRHAPFDQKQRVSDRRSYCWCIHACEFSEAYKCVVEDTMKAESAIGHRIYFVVPLHPEHKLACTCTSEDNLDDLSAADKEAWMYPMHTQSIVTMRSK